MSNGTIKVTMGLKTQAPEIFPIFALGQVTGEGIEPFTVDAQSILKVQEDFRKKGVDLVIDYEHQTLTGDVAPAAGWVKDFCLQGAALACKAVWTEKAKQYINNGEYRYFSPVVKIDEERRLIAIHSMALTNLPVGHDLQALTAMKKAEGVRPMNEIIKYLGLGSESTESDVINAIKQREVNRKELIETLGLPADSTEIMSQIQQYKAAAINQPPACPEIVEEVGLKKGAGKSEIIAAIRAMKQTQAIGVSVAEFQDMKHKLAGIETEKLVTLAMSQGKITAAQKGWAEKYANDDPEGFKAFTEMAPVVVIMKQVAGEETEKGKAATITEEEKLIAAQMGVKEADLKKYNH